MTRIYATIYAKHILKGVAAEGKNSFQKCSLKRKIIITDWPGAILNRSYSTEVLRFSPVISELVPGPP